MSKFESLMPFYAKIASGVFHGTMWSDMAYITYNTAILARIKILQFGNFTNDAKFKSCQSRKSHCKL